LTSMINKPTGLFPGNLITPRSSLHRALLIAADSPQCDETHLSYLAV
jgi:hypothetical protein